MKLIGILTNKRNDNKLTCCKFNVITSYYMKVHGDIIRPHKLLKNLSKRLYMKRKTLLPITEKCKHHYEYLLCLSKTTSPLAKRDLQKKLHG